MVRIKESSEKLYFVVESKGADLGLDIKTTESSKIKCGKKHFESLESDVELVQAKDYNNFMEKF
nr:hypothetical protein [Aliarcobacter cryaerophilus]